MAKKRKWSKSWVKRERSFSIDDKFNYNTDKHKRVYLTEFWLSPYSSRVLERVAEIKRISRSAVLDIEIRKSLFVEEKKCRRWTLDGKKRKAYSGNSRLKARGWKRYRKLMIHPSFLKIIKERKDKEGISWSVFWECFLRNVGEKYNIK